MAPSRTIAAQEMARETAADAPSVLMKVRNVSPLSIAFATAATMRTAARAKRRRSISNAHHRRRLRDRDNNTEATHESLEDPQRPHLVPFAAR